jgi:hypothetical protein
VTLLSISSAIRTATSSSLLALLKYFFITSDKLIPRTSLNAIGNIPVAEDEKASSETGTRVRVASEGSTDGTAEIQLIKLESIGQRRNLQAELSLDSSI